MADKKISQLTASTTPLAGTEELAVVQSGVTKKVSVANLTAERAVSTGALTSTTGTFSSYARVTGEAFPSTGAGMEITYNNGSVIRSYDRSGSVYKPLSLRALSVDFQAGGSARLSVAQAGDVTVNTGNLVIGTAGKGIDFSADGQAAGMTSELLDDYEEGTWTPVVADAASGGNVGTAGSAYGTYVKTGNLVFVTCVLVNINTTGLTAGNSFFVQGLPFASFDMPLTTAYYLSGGVLTGSVTISSPVTAYVQDNTSLAAAFFDSGGAILVSDLTSTSADFYFSLTYRTA